MKKILVLSTLIAFTPHYTKAQAYSPIATTGYTLDAVAENTTALANTTGAIDGSNYVMYSAAYGVLMGSTYGLPNSGLLTSGTRTYQLQSYTLANVLFQTVNTVDSLVLITPAAYGGLSLLGFATEGSALMNITVRFTDNSTAVYSNIALPDWFTSSANTVLNGFDRCGRTTGTPALTAGSAGNPRMVYVDLPINCINRAKLVKTVKIQNASTNTARTCIMGLSGASVPVFTPSTSPVTCTNGTNGSGTISVSGGVSPFTYTVQSTPVQTSSVAVNLPVGVYAYVAQDAGLCPTNGTFAVTQSLVAQPPLNMSWSATNICVGSSVAIGASGSISYTWSTGSNQQQIIDNPTSTSTYTVGGFTSANCYVTGSVTVNVNTLPAVSLSGVPANMCINNPTVSIVVSPGGGTLTGSGITGGVFSPILAGAGTKTLNYIYADANNCKNSASLSVVVNAVPDVTLSALSNQCLNSPSLSLSGTPLGGSFSGTGVNGSAFSPAAAGVGTQTVTYTYTDANNCTGTTAQTVLVNALPAITFSMSKTSFCNTSPIQLLNAQPTGGTFTGGGITGSVFSPSVAGAGTKTITYTYSDNDNGCTDSRAVTVTVSACSNLNELENSNAFYVFPNPNNGTFTLRANNTLELLIVNELGQVVDAFVLNNNNAFTMPLNNLHPGVYYIIAPNGERFKQKIIVLK